jgi:hypothetical protein
MIFLKGRGGWLPSRYSLMGKNVILHVRTSWKQVLDSYQLVARKVSSIDLKSH